MPRPTDPSAARERAFNELPITVRTDIAQARNMRARMLEKRDAYLAESKVFKTMLRRLHNVHKLSVNKIALLMGLTWDRVDDIIQDRKGRK